MNYCSNCGAKLSTESNYCPKCGQEIKAGRENNASMNNQQTPKAAPSFDYSQKKRHAKVKAHTPEQGSFENDSTVEFSDLHPNAVWLFFLRYAAKSSILIPLIVIGAVLMPLLWILLGAYLLATYAAARVTYSNYQFKVTPTAFIKEYGIIHKNHATIPFATIENININRTLIDRLLGLAHVEIETAGTSGNAQKDIVAGVAATAEGYIPGLSRQEAYDLRDLMLLRAHKSRG